MAAVLTLSVLFLVLPGARSSATFTIKNECGYTVWPGLLSSAGSAPLPTTAFALAPGGSRAVAAPAPAGWSGRMWVGTLCAAAADDAAGGNVQPSGALLGIVIAGKVTAIFVLLTPMITIHSAWKNGTVGALQAYSYGLAFLNCLMWVAYAIPSLPNPTTMLEIAINGAGAILELAYFVFCIYHRNGTQRKIASGFFVASIVMFAVVLVLVFTKVVTHVWSPMFVGVLAAVSGVLIYANPAFELRKMVNAQDVKDMNKCSVVWSLANAVLGVANALVSCPPNWFVIVPNVFGVLCTTAQMIAWVRYRNTPELPITLPRVPPPSPSGAPPPLPPTSEEATVSTAPL